MIELPWKLGKENRFIGVHYDGGRLSAVLMEKHGDSLRMVDQLQLAAAMPSLVASDDPEEGLPEDSEEHRPEPDALAAALDELAQRWRITSRRRVPVALSLGASLYRTERCHSEFTDPRMIKQTIRFDMEEVFVVDAESVLLCYQFLPPSGDGTDIVVHVCERALLSDLSECFDRAGLDAMLIQPDSASWIHYCSSQSQVTPGEPALLLASGGAMLYLQAMDAELRPLVARTCYVESDDPDGIFLRREMQRTVAMLGTQSLPGRLFYHDEDLPHQRVQKAVDELELHYEALPQSSLPLAQAEGAVRGYLDGTTVDFRRDGFSARTVRQSQQWALSGLAISVTLLMLVLGITVKVREHHYNSLKKQALDSIRADWKKLPNTSSRRRTPLKSTMIREIREMDRKLKGEKSAQSKELPESLSGTLEKLLGVVLALPENTDFRIENISLQSDRADLSGTLGKLADGEALKDAVDSSGFTLVKWNISQGSENRRNLTMTVETISTEPSSPRRRGK